jgi:hypothetical protein
LSAILEDDPRHIRVIVEDSVLTLSNPELRGDTLLGFERLEPTDTVHVSAVQAVESRHFELGKTAAVVGISLAIPVAVLLVSVALSDDAVPLE